MVKGEKKTCNLIQTFDICIGTHINEVVYGLHHKAFGEAEVKRSKL